MQPTTAEHPPCVHRPGVKAQLRRKRHSDEFISFHSLLKGYFSGFFVYNADVLFEKSQTIAHGRKAETPR